MDISDWWSRFRWSIYAPVYDILARPFEGGRRRAFERLNLESGDDVLILGCGTGSDLEYLPEGVSATAVDISPAMVTRTRERAEDLDIDVDTRLMDAQELPFEDDKFDVVLLHLVLSVVPDPEALMEETARVLGADGEVSIYDKFIEEEEEPSLPRRLANPVARFLFADLNRRLEPMLSDAGLETGQRDSFIGGIYQVTIARPTEE